MNVHVSAASEAARNEANEVKYYDQLHSEKYRDKDQSRLEHSAQIALKLGSTPDHRTKLYESLVTNRFLPAGRVQAAAGASEREVSFFNCSVSQVIKDDMRSIMDALGNAAMILRLGTGIGYNFSNIRPKGALIGKLQTEASGPLSFMKMYDVMASTIASSGHRRGAQMGILNVSHPDIEAFIDAKMQPDTFRQFNLSVGISDAFMQCVKDDKEWALTFNGQVYRTVKARSLWERITQNAYNSAEPGIIFIDRLNDQNNLHYCETIEATNPCAEQPLPPYGMCLLGSFNLAAYVRTNTNGVNFDYGSFIDDIHIWVEAYDNIFEQSIYAIPEHEIEAKSKRRMGLGFTGIASAIEMLCGRASYGESDFITYLDHLCRVLRDEAYRASIRLAQKRGAFDKFDADGYTSSKFIQTMPSDIIEGIRRYGIRNSHLISFAPTGTISMCAGNVSGGVEPVFHYEQSRNVIMANGPTTVTLRDYNYRAYGFKGKTLEDCTVDQHMAVSKIVQKYCDSAVSKTVNVSTSCTYDEYRQIYEQAHGAGLKGITVFRYSPEMEKIRGIVIAKAEQKEEEKIEVYNNSAAVFDSIPTGCVSGMCSL